MNPEEAKHEEERKQKAEELRKRLEFVRPLVALIEGHAVNHHQVFERLSRARPSPDKLEEWLCHMAWFCILAREVFTFPDNLREHGRGEVAEVIEKIRTNEQEHALLYARMASHLVGRRVFTREVRSPGMEQMKRVFVNRDYDDVECVYYSLGAYLALDIMTDQHIIPGQIRAFVNSGYYGTSLDEPSMKYLWKHKAESSADTLHGMKLMSAIILIPMSQMSGDAYSHMERGVKDFLDALVVLYDELAVTVQ